MAPLVRVTYRQTRPPALARAAVSCLWSIEVDAPGSRLIVPDACSDVIWHRRTGALFVAGPDTGAHPASMEPGEVVGLRFAPGASAFAAPASALRDDRVDLADLWPAERARLLADRLAATPDIASAHRVLLAEFPAALSGRTADVRARAARGESVRDIADALGITERHLHRESLRAFGYGVKTLHRVIRFDRALRLARASTPFASAALRAGYADQAHMARDVRALSGVRLRDLLG